MADCSIWNESAIGPEDVLGVHSVRKKQDEGEGAYER